MIHLDTNALIALPLWAKEGHPVIQRIAAGEAAGVSAVVWYEFLIGPILEAEVSLAHAFIRGNIIALDMVDARLAADLYNHAGRRRTLKTDALIAAMAIRARALFLTLNTDDFLPFLPYGLVLAQE
ncbi:PIN domain-containing protein [uncultured Thiodictyon sp.]|jgi:predicted nucleic acid-binding protein|uniref:type II toxin-antitoxin system VapC family toxin n=1 Tax=uncultured Thiodictyon sp. TaxID=1846217 RepID=UPI0025FDC425|nr:PIN domain-containing protein [uncultured Thiodictyon sp.]